MSHLVKKACTLQDMNTLLEAARNLGWTVQQGGKAKFFSGYSGECEYVLTPLGEVNDRGDSLKYTIGVTVEAGKINLHYDNAMNSQSMLFGDDEDACTQRIIGKLKQSYQKITTQQFARNKRWSSQARLLDNGKVVVRIRVG